MDSWSLSTFYLSPSINLRLFRIQQNVSSLFAPNASMTSFKLRVYKFLQSLYPSPFLQPFKIAQHLQFLPLVCFISFANSVVSSKLWDSLPNLYCYITTTLLRCSFKPTIFTKLLITQSKHSMCRSASNSVW